MARSGDDFFMPAADSYRLQRRLAVSEPVIEAVAHVGDTGTQPDFGF